MLRSTVFVPAPAGKPGAPAAACAAAVLGAAGNAHADAIGDAAAKLSKAACPFMKEVPWNSGSYNLPAGSADPIGYTKAIAKMIDMGAHMDSKLLKAGAEAQLMAINAALGRMIAPVPESTTMGVYSAVGGLMDPKVPACPMSTVKESDARAAYNAFIDFTQVVKANPITPSAPTSSVSGSAASSIAAAADELSAAAYPFVEDIDWTSDLYSKPTLGADPQKVAKAIGNMITMGAAMDGASLKEADIAHVKAIGGMDAKGVLLQSDFAPINAGLGKAVASVPTSKVMDVYNSMAQGVGSPGVPNKLSSTENPADAQAARGALLEFKDVAKAAQR
ncbi:unnamed protein product [Prorocentrum cordatum]|uniref:Chloroplast soluble peridinin-chlorophyll a-binding protein n=1 Tax=Prorocentrum cordatum TaxID=2364126 RepID=A0ABN9W9G5_9DINO|nr:unnamed protein product [Polarella glacialis]